SLSPVVVQPPPRSPLFPYTTLFRSLAGGLPMLAAVAVEVLAVLGRAGPWPLPGSIEVVQVLILLSGMTAMVVATLNGSHARVRLDRKSTRLNSSHVKISYAVFCLKK